MLDDLRNFCKRRFFVKLKISTLSTFWINGQPEKVVYKGATKFFLTKCSYFDELRNFCKRQIFVKLKITLVSTFGKLGRTDRVDYRGTTKNF